VSITIETEVITRLAMRGPLKQTALAAGTHRHLTTIRKAVRQLIEDGEIVRDKEGRLTLATATKEKAAPKAKATKEKAEVAPRSGPRAHTQELDAKVMKAIGTGKTGKTKGEIAAATGASESLVYGALHRLKKAGRVSINRVEGSRTPTYTAA
jgi:predicted transcriptional regulator